MDKVLSFMSFLINLNKLYQKQFFFRINVSVFDDCSKIFIIYCKYFDDSSAKLAFFIEDIQYALYDSLCKGSAVRLKNFIGSSFTVAVYTTHRSFIYKHLNLILEKLIPAGIPQHLYELHKFMLFKKYEPIMDSGPKVLTIDDLSFGFVLWLGACGISVAGFVLEMLMFQLRKVLRTFIGLWGILRILRWRLKAVVL